MSRNLDLPIILLCCGKIPPKFGQNHVFIQFSVILCLILDIFDMVVEALELEWPK